MKIIFDLENFYKAAVLSLSAKFESTQLEKTRGPKIVLPQSISQKNKLLNVRDPSEVRERDILSLGKGTRLEEGTPLRLGKGIPPDFRKGANP